MKKNVAYLLSVLLALSGFYACKTRHLSPREYVRWMHDDANGLRVKKSIAGFEFALQYKNPEYMILQEHKSDTISQREVETQVKDFDGLQYYTLFLQSSSGEELLKAGISEESEYYSRLEYFCSPAQDDMLLVENGDTLPCVLYHFERNYGLSPQTAIVLGFEKGKMFATSDKQFIYNDQVLGTGPVLFTIKAADIQQIPTIDYAHD